MEQKQENEVEMELSVELKETKEKIGYRNRNI
jgi:hypothetical protein